MLATNLYLNTDRSANEQGQFNLQNDRQEELYSLH